MSRPKTYLKYLPVEGEIKVGDYYYFNGKLLRCEPYAAMPPIEESLTKVERFAVTTDIEKGDEVNYQHLGKWCKDECSGVKKIHILLKQDDGMEYVLRKDEAFKIIAPISPHVTWEIKDGAEIEVVIIKGIDIQKPDEKTALVKGPCGHYH